MVLLPSPAQASHYSNTTPPSRPGSSKSLDCKIWPSCTSWKPSLRLSRPLPLMCWLLPEYGLSAVPPSGQQPLFSSFPVPLLHPCGHSRNHPTVVVLNILSEKTLFFFCSKLHIYDSLSLLGNMKRNPVPLMLWTQLYYLSLWYQQDCTRITTCCISDAWNSHALTGEACLENPDPADIWCYFTKGNNAFYMPRTLSHLQVWPPTSEIKKEGSSEWQWDTN